MGLTLAALTIGITVRRRLPISPASQAFFVLGTIFLALAAGSPVWRHHTNGTIAVIVDTSASTRGATYHDEATLGRRLVQLIGDRPFTLVRHDGVQSIESPDNADVLLLFSDGRARVSSPLPPTYVIIDPALESPGDARIEDIQWRDEQLAISVVNNGTARSLTSSLNAPARAATIPAKTSVVVTVPAARSLSSVQLSADDRWPENDVLSIAPPPTTDSERWWISQGTGAVADFTIMQPPALPDSASAYLGISLIVLDNVPAGALSDAQQRALSQYVRDLGGALMIVGGDQAFGAGGYTGTALDALSPLASDPPTPTTHWILLVDSSGSMSAPFEQRTRWAYAVDALQRTLQHLPPADPLSIGSFAESLRWWTTGGTVRDASAAAPPADVKPHGPTNLNDALRTLANSTDAKLPTQVILLTDAEAQIDLPDALAATLKDRQITFNLLIAGGTPAAGPLEQIVKSTGGQITHEPDPRQWATAAKRLTHGPSRDNWIEEPSQVRFIDALSALRSRTLPAANRTWPKADATSLAITDTEGTKRTLAARWSLGAGTVAASAFPLNNVERDALVQVVEQPTSDPRFRVRWNVGSALRVTLDAADESQIINGLTPTLMIYEVDGTTTPRSIPFAQVGPGRYEVEMTSPRVASIATVHVDGYVIARRALAGRYAPEFDAIGNDRRAMKALADRTGGEVIEPGRTRPIELRFPEQRRLLTAWLAALAVALLGAGLLIRR